MKSKSEEVKKVLLVLLAVHASLITATAQTEVPDTLLKAVVDTVEKVVDDFELAPLDSLITDETVRQLQEQSEGIARQIEEQASLGDSTVLMAPKLLGRVAARPPTGHVAGLGHSRCRTDI